MACESEATVEFVVSERLSPPPCETDDIVVAAPREVVDATHPKQLIRFLPIVTAVASVAVIAVAYTARSSMARNPIILLFPLMMLVSATATVLTGANRRRGELNVQRADYFAYLAEVRVLATKTAVAQRESAIWCHPEPDALWAVTGGRRMWERTPDNPDFCHVRIGLGTVPLARRLITRVVEHRQDPVSAAALRRLVEVRSVVPKMPVTVALHGTAAVTIRGEPTRAQAVVRAMVCQLAVMHSPALVGIAAVVGDRSRPDWEWLKWLPHNRDTRTGVDAGAARMVYSSPAAAREALDTIDRQLVVVVDSDEGSAGLPGSLVTIDAGGDEPPRIVVAGEEVAAQSDSLSYDAALVCAQRLAGYRPARGASTGGSWQELVAGRRGRRLSVPVGTTAAGATVELDINEAAANGMGPHGLCIGATGSGKSEFLRTVALGMIVGHPSDELNVILVDFKGGATFAGFEPAPHVAAVITNLSDKAALVARMRDALMGEMHRRQEVLRQAGNLDGIAAYHRRRRIDPALHPLPTLFIIVDEFSELLSQHPDFADVFVAIGRLGRSLGVHLLLASQRLDEGRLRGLESHLSYRVCLKTLSVNESRMVLGSSDAYELPSTPGAAYLRVGTEAPVRFQTAFVSGPAATPAAPTGETSAAVGEFTAAPVGRISVDREPETAEHRTVLQTIIEQLPDDGPRAHEVWLPPLAASPTLNDVLCEAGPIRALTAPIGIVDRPFEQRRAPLVVDLSGAAGNVALVGAPQSGKSTALRTLIAALAATHGPRTVQFYCLDFGGGALASLRDCPHVGSVAGRADPERVRRTIVRLAAVVRSREALFRRHGVESMAQYRQLKAERNPLCDDFGDVFLVVDGWLTLQRELDVAEQSITALAAEGLSYGVHVVMTASRWPEIRPALRDQIGTRIELRLGEPADSEVDRRRAHEVPGADPGRGLSPDGLHMMIALPQSDPLPHDGWSALPIPVLPERIEQSRIDRVPGIVIGVEETELRPVAIDFTKLAHLLILGDGECGKTATLRTLCHELRRTAGTEVLLVDARRGSSAPADAVAGLRQRLQASGPEIFVLIDDYDLLGADLLAPLVAVLPRSRDVGLHLVVARRTGGAARAMFEPLLAGMRDAGCMTLLMSGSPDEGLTIGSIRPSPLPPGRGVLITRRGDAQLIQVGWTPPS